jgi:oligosaccharide reducing-end xylanase
VSGGGGAGLAGGPAMTGGRGNAKGGASGAGMGGSAGALAGSSAGAAAGSSGSDGIAGGPASAATATVVGSGCTAPAAYANLFITLLGETQASSNAKLEAAWNQLYNPSNANTVFYNGPGTGEAYVKDIADNDVRSEGQSYGMMTAVQLDHQAEFDALWTFAKNHMVKSSGGGISSITWSVATSGGSNGKSGGAPDGDEWFAAALVFAHKRWGDTSGKFAYGTEAHAVLDMVRNSDFDAPSHLVRYYAGTSSNGTDGSYVLPAFYQTWACFDTANASFWNAAVSAGRTFFHNAADSNGVIGDQSSFSGQTTNSSGADKLRCVANIMSDDNFFAADAWQTQTYAPEYGTHESKGTSSTAQLACDGLLGFGLPASSGKTFVQKLWSAPIPSGQWRYYDGTLYTIALLHVSGGFRLWY